MSLIGRFEHLPNRPKSDEARSALGLVCSQMADTQTSLGEDCKSGQTYHVETELESRHFGRSGLIPRRDLITDSTVFAYQSGITG